MIPHDFGLGQPPLLDNVELIKSKCEMIDNLLEIEIAYSMLDDSNNSVEGDEHPIDGHYKKLKCALQPVDRHSEEFLRIEQYMIKTHAKTHDQYTLKLRDLFRTSRQGESDRTKRFQQVDNHQLLWHGSRTTNFAGILSQGLRIAPPEAPVVSDTAMHCSTVRQPPTDRRLFSFRQVTCLAKESTSPTWSRKVVSTRSLADLSALPTVLLRSLSELLFHNQTIA